MQSEGTALGDLTDWCKVKVRHWAILRNEPVQSEGAALGDLTE